MEARAARRDPAAAVAAAAPYDVPVTMKTRKGLDDDHLTYLDAGRIAQESGVRRDRAARADGGAGLQRPGRLGGDRAARRARRHPGARQRRHLGGRRRAADGRADRRRGRRRRPRLPGPALALPRPRRRLRRATTYETLPTLGEVAHDDAPPRRAAQRAHGRGARLQGVPQARLVVPQGLPRRRHAAALAGPGRLAWPRSTYCSPSSTPTSRSRSPSSGARAVGRARRGSAWCSPRAGSTTPTAPGCG